MTLRNFSYLFRSRLTWLPNFFLSYTCTRRTVEWHRDAEARSAFLIDWGRPVSPKCKNIVSDRKGRIRRSCGLTTNRTLGRSPDRWDMSRVHMSGILARPGPVSASSCPLPTFRLAIRRRPFQNEQNLRLSPVSPLTDLPLCLTLPLPLPRPPTSN